MQPTVFQEKLVQDIATRTGECARCVRTHPSEADRSVTAGHSAAQVLLKWSLQLGVPTQFRSIQPAHMRENMAVLAMPDLSQQDM